MSRTPKPLPAFSDADLLWVLEHIDIQSDNACWPWLGNRDKDGYGRMMTKHNKARVPRVVYMIFSGSDPYPLDILHSCDNPPCCNPRHLSAGTAADNNRDMCAKGRDRYVAGDAHYTKHYDRELLRRRVPKFRVRGKWAKAPC